ncbi:MAG: hypothetical protein KatS3mg071_1622 [Meiothermus sp.]|nr:MAG: hypothetical protein KatS3mg071_1622 [Meiothermus sp.]
MKAVVLTLFLALLGAWAAPWETHIANARAEILVQSEALTNATLAKALHEAVTRRGIPVYILHGAETAESPYVYLGGLQLAGARVRLMARLPQGTTVLVDQRVAINLARGQVSTTGVAGLRQRYVDLYRQAKPWSYRAKVPPQYTELEKHPINDLIALNDREVQNQINLTKNLPALRR